MIRGDPTAAIKEQWWSLFNDPQLDRLIEVALAENLDVQAPSRGSKKPGRWSTFASGSVSTSWRHCRRRARTNQYRTTPLPGVSLPIIFILPCWMPLRAGFMGKATARDRSGSSAAFVYRICRTSGSARAGEPGRAVLFRPAQPRSPARYRARDLGIPGRIIAFVTKRFEGGVVSELDVQQAESEAAVAAAAVPDLEQQIVQKENELSVLLGRNPEDITRGRGIFEFGDSRGTGWLAFHSACPAPGYSCRRTKPGCRQCANRRCQSSVLSAHLFDRLARRREHGAF